PCPNLNLKPAVTRGGCLTARDAQRHAGRTDTANYVDIATEMNGRQIGYRNLSCIIALGSNDELQRLAPVTGLSRSGGCAHAPEVNAGTQVPHLKLCYRQLIALDHFS